MSINTAREYVETCHAGDAVAAIRSILAVYGSDSPGVGAGVLINAPVRMTLTEGEWGDWTPSMCVITPAGEYERRCTRDGSAVYTDSEIRRALNANGEQAAV